MRIEWWKIRKESLRDGGWEEKTLNNLVAGLAGFMHSWSQSLEKESFDS